MALIEHLEKLRHFYKISRYRSINEAASISGLSQAGLSKSLLLLEGELGCQLFKRSRDGLTLTSEGIELLEFTRGIFEGATALENRIQSLKSAQAPQIIRVGMYDSIAVYFGLKLQEYLKTIYPKVTMELCIDRSPELFHKMVNSELDLIFGVNFPLNKLNKMKHFELFNDYFSFYVAPQFAKNFHDLPFLANLNSTDISGIPLQKILKKTLKNKIIHSIQNFETLKILTSHGVGIGVLPTRVALPLLTSGLIVNIQLEYQENLVAQHRISLLVRSSIAESFSEFTKDILRLSERWVKL